MPDVAVPGDPVLGEPVPTPAQDRPAGVVTFLFSDIEGSSRLEQRVGTARYAGLRERHRILLRSAFAAYGGLEQGTSGDSFFVVFGSAAGAVQASIAGQRALAGEPWPEGAAIRVRIGVHSGDAIVSLGDYVGIDINRAARIEAAAHGGQIVVSDTTRALAATALEDETGFVDLGLHRLKDFAPLRLHQVIGPGLVRDFPPLRSLDARFINLQAAVTSFVGRRREVEDVGVLLRSGRLLTLTGPGGTGKTRLSIAAAESVLDAFPAGAAWVGLSPLADAALVPAAVATVLGVLDDGTHDIVDALADRIGSDRFLLVLDNFEQVVGAAPVVGRLLARCPGLTVLVTSREVLRLAGEREYPVPPLAVPAVGDAIDLETAAGSESIALFVERARAVRPDFALHPDNVRAIAAIVARLDGLPLAIELAAARIRILAPAALLARLEQSLGILADGARDLPERQRTLRGAIAWSYDLLDEAEAALFRRLAVFAGGWDMDAVTPVCDPTGDLGVDVLDGLESLAEKSLIRQLDADGEPRFRMLQTIREYGLEQLEAAGELGQVRDRHLGVIAELARVAEPELVGEDTKRWLDRLELEHDNIRAALRWALEADQVETGLLTAGRLWRFWHQRGHLGEGLAVTRALLACPAAVARTAARARALNGAGGLAYWQNDFTTAATFYEEELGIFEDLGDRAGLAETYYNLGFLAAIPGDHAVAVERYERALALWRELGDEFGLASGLLGLALVLFLKRDYERGRQAAQEALAQAEAIGDRFRRASSLGVIGRIAMETGDHETARMDGLRSLDLFAEVGDPTGVAMQLDDLGQLACRQDDAARALRLGGAAAALRDRIAGGAPPTLVRLGDYVDDARRALDPRAAEEAWQAGRTMTQETAVAYARQSPGPAGTPA
jgi:predicted ATPase/class 3 adenylate cyclase